MRSRRWVGAMRPPETSSQREGAVETSRSRPPTGAGGAFDAFRARLRTFIESRRVQQTITAIIVLNAITLGLDTSERAVRYAGDLLEHIDRVILGVFVLELASKMVAWGPVGFFRRGWNVFDFIVVGIALVPSAGALSVLRALRILRVLRLVSVVPAMRKVVQALLTAIPGVASIIALLFLVFYVFGVICTKLYGAAFPQWFGTIGESMYSLFQIMTLESWSMGIVRPVMAEFPQAWLVFVPFILITSFAVLNLFIAVIVNAMQEQQATDLADARETLEEDIEQQTKVLTAEITELRRELREVRGMLSGKG
jgi:voltage-gated sodium channel